jgi:hypothetical protein
MASIVVSTGTTEEDDMTTTTRKATISSRKVAAEGGAAYCATWIGLKAIYTTWEGERLVGTITHWSTDGMYPCVTFADGTWGRLNHEVEIVNA